MEPSEFDKLIKGKLSQENELHAHEMEKAKPFVWTAIHGELNKKPFLIRWQYAAAATLLLLIGFSFLFFFLQQQHVKEMQQIAQKVEALQNNYGIQATTLQYKNQELNALCNEVSQLENSILNSSAEKTSVLQSNSIVYQTDTVYVTQVEYITVNVPPKDSLHPIIDSPTKSVPIQTDDEVAEGLSNDQEVYNKIYPRYVSAQGEPKTDESIKIKFSSFNPN